MLKDPLKDDPPKDPVEQRCVLLLPGESNSSLVVKVLSRSEFEMIDDGHTVQCRWPSSDGENNVFLLKVNLVCKVLKFIWASKQGLQISEILEILNQKLEDVNTDNNEDCKAT